MNELFRELEERLGIEFKHRQLLEQALTHRSYLTEAEEAESNERLEFLGDAVLDLIIAEELYKQHADWAEGRLTKAKAATVDERSLEQMARSWHLGKYVRISHGEEAAGGRERRSLLADAVEAVIGAFYLDSGMRACRKFVLREMRGMLSAVERRELGFDYKTQLQEYLQGRYQATPSYRVISESGPPHDRVFHVAVSFDGTTLGSGEGKSKKEAEQHAAEKALKSLEASGD